MASEKMKLYWFPAYRSVRNIWLIKEMDVEKDFEYIRYKPNDDPAANAAYRKDVHPHGTVPCLVVPGEPPVLESGAICMYLADRYGKLVPDPKDRRDYYDFIMYANVTLEELLDFFFQLWELEWEEKEEKVEKMRDKANACLDYLSRRLEGRQYLCGDSFTAADCILGFNIYYFSVLKGGELLKNYPKIQEYLARLQARPAYQATMSMT